MIDEKNPLDSLVFFDFIFLLKVGFLCLKLDPLSEPESDPALIGSVAALLISSGSAAAAWGYSTENVTFFSSSASYGSATGSATAFFSSSGCFSSSIDGRVLLAA